MTIRRSRSSLSSPSYAQPFAQLGAAPAGSWVSLPDRHMVQPCIASDVTTEATRKVRPTTTVERLRELRHTPPVSGQGAVARKELGVGPQGGK